MVLDSWADSLPHSLPIPVQHHELPWIQHASGWGCTHWWSCQLWGRDQHRPHVCCWMLVEQGNLSPGYSEYSLEKRIAKALGDHLLLISQVFSPWDRAQTEGQSNVVDLTIYHPDISSRKNLQSSVPGASQPFQGGFTYRQIASPRPCSSLGSHSQWLVKVGT